MFFGEGSNHKKEEELSHAKSLHEQGISNEEIFLQTGWFVGLEGKWRVEMYDGDLELSDDFLRYLRCGASKDADVENIVFEKAESGNISLILNTQERAIEDSIYLHEVPEEELKLHLPEPIANRIAKAASESPERQEISEKFWFDGVPKSFPLPLVFKSHPIFKSHHQFWGTTVELSFQAKLAHAGKIDGSPFIQLNPTKCSKLPQQLIKEIMIHETQHVIQDAEGFARGGAAENFHVRDKVDEFRREAKEGMNAVLQSDPAFAKALTNTKALYFDIKSKYGTEELVGEVEWDNVPEELEDAYFEARDTLYDEHNESLTAYEDAFYKVSFNEHGISAEDRFLSTKDQYMLLTGEQEAYDAENRVKLSQGERKLVAPVLAKRDAKGLTFTSDEELLDYIWKENVARTERTRIDVSPYGESFSTISIGERAGLEDIIPMFSTTMLRMYSELSRELPEDNQLVKDFNVITAWLDTTPNEFYNMDYLKRNALEEKFAQGFMTHLGKPNKPTPLKAVFSTLNKWLAISLNKLIDYKVKIDTPDDMKDVYQRLTDLAPQKVSADSDFQTKINAALQHSSREVIDVNMALASIVDSGYSSIAEMAGLVKADVQKRFDIEMRRKGNRRRPKNLNI
ncbi:LPD23 domain-containing protein [Vibrio crassostreae]|uniref:LPD23 domain-containing protein n=1 Tax=Vibrio crassostreae TaxID=246167 RepID=UPI001B317001|nr:LPD23 domain-containing protein [Vibrio crassostreae]